MLTQTWRMKDQQYQLKGAKNDAQDVTFPPRPTRSRQTETYTFDVETPVAEVAPSATKPEAA